MLDREERLLATIAVAVADVGSAKPAADFMARVRGHVETEQRAAPTQWWMGSVVAMVATLVVAALVFGPFRHPPRADRQAAAVGPTEPPPVARVDPLGPRVTNARPAAPPRPRIQRQGETNLQGLVTDPEVLVPARQRAAVDRLFASLRAGRPEVVSMLMSIQGPERETEAGTLAVEPLRIEPVVIPTLPSAGSILDR